MTPNPRAAPAFAGFPVRPSPCRLAREVKTKRRAARHDVAAHREAGFLMATWKKALLIASFGLPIAAEAVAEPTHPVNPIVSKPSRLSPPVLSAPSALPPPAALPGATSPCALLTPPVLRQAIERIAAARAKAEANVAAHLPGYPSAATQARDYLVEAQDKMLALEKWLTDNKVDKPFIANTTAAYNTHGYARETMGILYYAEHWAAISAVYNHSFDAKAAADISSEATGLLSNIGTHALACYMHGYFQ
jgi:hypothetical protein